jgi:hypothetical protein
MLHLDTDSRFGCPLSAMAMVDAEEVLQVSRCLSSVLDPKVEKDVVVIHPSRAVLFKI